MKKPHWNRPADFIKEVALVLDQADAATVTAGKFVNERGCLCPLGLMAVKYSGKAKQAVEGLRSLVAANVIDRDMLEAIALRIDDVVIHEVKCLMADMSDSLEVRSAVTETHDVVYRIKGKAAVVARLHLIAKEFAA